MLNVTQSERNAILAGNYQLLDLIIDEANRQIGQSKKGSTLYTTKEELLVTWRCPECGGYSLADPTWATMAGECVSSDCDNCFHKTQSGYFDFKIEVWQKVKE